jgi:hypothetical protein
MKTGPLRWKHGGPAGWGARGGEIPLSGLSFSAVLSLIGVRFDGLLASNVPTSPEAAGRFGLQSDFLSRVPNPGRRVRRSRASVAKGKKPQFAFLGRTLWGRRRFRLWDVRFARWESLLIAARRRIMPCAVSSGSLSPKLDPADR